VKLDGLIVASGAPAAKRWQPFHRPPFEGQLSPNTDSMANYLHICALAEAWNCVVN